MRRLLLLALVALLAGCGGGGGKSAGRTTTATRSGGCARVPAPPAQSRHEAKPTQALDPAKIYDVSLRTNCGAFTIRLDQRQSPHATASFVSLVQKGYFDHTVFHRIIPGFVIQGGDPTATGTGGPGYTTVDRPPRGARYVHGVVAMAKTGAQPRGTAGSQFFVVTARNAGLGPDYAIIGRVVKGLAVVDRIGALGDPSGSGTPTRVVEIEQASVAVS